jgi:capsular exopolysaccharide synthesis family protein
LIRLWAAIRRRWRLFVAIFGGFVLLVGIATILAPKSYTTTVRLMAGRPGSDLGSNQQDTAFPVLNALVLQNGEQSAETLAQLAQQRDIAARVVQQLKLPTTPEGLLRRVSVKPVVNTALLNLSVSWNSPQTSSTVANTFGQAFVEQERDFVRSEATAAIGFLEQELPNAQTRMRQTAARLAQFQSANGFIDAGAHTQDVLNRVGNIDQRIDQLTVDVKEAQALYGNVNGQLAALPPTIDSAKQVSVNPVLTDLKSKLAAVDTQLAAAEQEYTPAHPTVISLRQQKAALEAQVAAQPSSVESGDTTAPNPVYQSLQQQASTYKARIDGDNAQLKQLNAERAAYKPSLKALPTQTMQFAVVQQDAKRAADVYNALSQKYSDALIARTTAISDISIVQAATPDTAIKSPSLRINLAIALVIGLVLALAVVYILDAMERRVRSDTDFPILFGLPLIARIPAIDISNPRMLPWVQSMTIEAFLHLCITLRLKNKQPLRTLAVMSPCRGDGKTTVALNLAKAMANLQPRVLLIDADLRRPSLHERTSTPNKLGLSDVVTQSCSLASAAHTIEPNLDLLTSGTHVDNPVSILQSAEFATLMDEARHTYSVVIVDAPPLQTFSDGLLICTRVDGTLLVVAANTTDEKEARNAAVQLSVLGIDNVLGIVLNKDTARVDDYSDYFSQSFRPSLSGGPS